MEEKYVRVRPAGDNPQTTLREYARHRARILQDLFLVDFEFGIERFFKSHRLGGNHVHQWPALQRRKHNRVESLRVLLGREDEATAGAAKRLMCRTGDEVGDSNRIWIESRCHQTGIM